MCSSNATASPPRKRSSDVFDKIRDWLAAAAVVVVGIALVVYLRSRGDKRGASLAAANAVEVNAERRIKRKRAKLEGLKRDITRNAGKIAKAEKSIEKERTILDAKFVKKGLSADESLARLRRLGLRTRDGAGPASPARGDD